MIEINSSLSIPKEELEFTATPSTGPGGQNVNKVSTRVCLSLDVERSPSLTDEQKRKIQNRLGNRISKNGVLRIFSQETRSQLMNRKLAEEKLARLLREALRATPPRKKTRVPAVVRKKRLQAKKRRGQLKMSRSNQAFDRDY